jgi:hypothetical protein
MADWVMLLMLCFVPIHGTTMTFGKPVIAGQQFDCAGFQGFDDKHALGTDEHGFIGTTDGGSSWKQVFQTSIPGTLHCTDYPAGGTGSNEHKCLHGNELHDDFTYVYNQGRGTASATCGKSASCWCCRCAKGGPCTAPVILKKNFTGAVSDSVLVSANSRHDLGQVVKVADKDQNYLSFNSTISTVFTAIGGVFTATDVNRSVVFKGIPSPGFSCGSKKHKFGCPFRTGGRGYVRLPDGTLVMSIIVWWGGSHANPHQKLAEAATSVVAFRSTDDGFTWDFSGSILDAAQAPNSEEGPNENDLTLLADGKRN